MFAQNKTLPSDFRLRNTPPPPKYIFTNIFENKERWKERKSYTIYNHWDNNLLSQRPLLHLQFSASMGSAHLRAIKKQLQIPGLCIDFLWILSLGFACGTERQSETCSKATLVLFWFYGASSGLIFFPFLLSLKSPLNSLNCQTPGRLLSAVILWLYTSFTLLKFLWSALIPSLAISNHLPSIWSVFELQSHISTISLFFI